MGTIAGTWKVALVALVGALVVGVANEAPARRATVDTEEIQLGVDKDGDGVLEADEVEETATIPVE